MFLLINADCIPIVVNNPAVISPIEVPTLTGSCFSYPVRLIIPPKAWTIKSYAGFLDIFPVCPNPEQDA